jgi:NADH-quinone oxidoreductase subunit N
VTTWSTFLAPLALELGTFALAVLVLLLGIAGVRSPRTIGWFTVAGLVALCALSLRMGPGTSAFGGSFVVDPLALFVKRVFLSASAISVLASLAFQQGAFARRSAEYHFGLLASLVGMLMLASARELILLFVSFELMSIPLYFLTGFQKRETTAAEAALKFFLIGTVSSAVVLYGFSFIYGATGTTAIAGIPGALQRGEPLILLGMALALAGLGFKIATVPFHMWVPDAYEAAAPPFVAWLSVAPKAAGFVVIVRLYLEGVGASVLVWLPVMAALAGVTIVAGNLMALPQRNIKRLLAYSGIAHIGYMLIGLAAMSAGGVATVLFYLVAYLFGNMGAFFVVQAVGVAEQSDDLDAYRGLAQRSPVLALAMLLFLLSLGGIPFVAGFWAKLYVFWAAVDRGLYGLVFLGALLTVVALYYYLIIASRMYIDAPVRPEPIKVPPALGAAIAICTLGVVVVGVYPGPWIAGVTQIAQSLF